MAAFEGSYKSLLQGVSQQVPSERQDGQISMQENMLSDPVTDLRRRPGCRARAHLSIAGSSVDTLRGVETDIGNYKRHVLVDTSTGVVRILDEGFVLEQTLSANPYLIAAERKSLRFATVDNELFIANTSIKPTLGDVDPDEWDPATQGFFYIKAGSLNRQYQVTVQYGVSGSVSATYSTPDGTSAGHAAQATPEYIAGQLKASLATAAAGAVAFFIDGAYVYCNAAAVVKVTSTTGDAYVVGSSTSYLQQAASLPLKLPAEADGYIVTTGSLSTPTYYKYVHDKLAWLECGVAGSPATLKNMPVSIRRNAADTAWEFSPATWEGRFAGDDESSPHPRFIERGLTGLSSYQGRLVLLAGDRVCMSASNKPRRHYRSTVTQVLVTDRCEAGASANSSSPYEYGVQFQKDLILFSEKYQALVPALGQAIGPANINVVITSTYITDTSSSPITLGKTLMYPIPRSEDFYGVMEMVPSQYTDSQYESNDATPHLPKYLPGRCRFAVSSSVASLALFGSDRDPQTVIVYEYLWSGNEKVQQAWHTWTLPYGIADAYFVGNNIVFLLVDNGTVVYATLDPRVGKVTSDADVRPFLDLYEYLDVADNTATAPAWMLKLDPSILSKVMLSNAENTLGGERVGFTYVGDSITTVRSFPRGRVAIGVPFRSAFSPTVPMVKDQNGVKISSNKLSVKHFSIGTANSAAFMVDIKDNYMDSDIFEVPTLTWSSAELMLGEPRLNRDSIAVVPARTAADTTVLVVYTEGVQELNVTSLEYTCRYNQKLRRR